MSETSPNLSASSDAATALAQIPSIVGGSPKKSYGMIIAFLGVMTLVGLMVCRSPHPKETSAAGNESTNAMPPAVATARTAVPYETVVTRPSESMTGGESLMDIRRKSPMVILNKQATNAPANPDTTPGGTTDRQNGQPNPSTGVPLPRGFSPSFAESAQATLLSDRENLIAQGKLIDAVLETSIDSDHPGLLRALVSHDVYADSGGNVLLPRGSRLIGQYDSAVAKGQNRVFVLWQRVIRPDGVDVQLGSAGTDPLGGTGIEGSVNYHFWAMFGAASLLSVIGGAASTVGVNPLDQNNSLAQYRENITNGLNSAAGTVLQEFTQIKPTIKVRQGVEIKVFVARDLHFDPALVGGQEYQVIQ